MDIVDYSQVHGWAVTSQATDQIIIDDAGRPITGTQVFFATEGGNRASIFAPDGHYTKKKVHTAISHRAALVDEIGRLTRDSLQ